MLSRSTPSGLLEAERRFRKVPGYRALPKLLPALGSFVPLLNLPFAIDRAMMRPQVRIWPYSISPSGAGIVQNEFAQRLRRFFEQTLLQSCYSTQHRTIILTKPKESSSSIRSHMLLLSQVH